MTAIDPGRPTTPAVPDLAASLGQLTTVKVNLLPAEITRARQGHKVRRIAVAAVAVLALVLAAVSVYARAGVGAARSDLAAADSLTASLRGQQARYADVVALQEQVRTATERLAQVTAGDIGWATLLSAVRAAAPAGVTLLSVDAAQDSGTAGSVGGAPGGAGDTTGTTAATGTASDPAAPADPTTTAAGTLTITGAAPSPAAVAAFVDALAAVTGLENVAATGVAALGTTGYSYGIAAVVTAAAAVPAPTTPGGK